MSTSTVIAQSLSRKPKQLGSRRSYLAAMIGNACQYYDSSIYGVMAPVLIGLFLPTMDSVDAYIWAYAAYPSSVVPAVLGAWFAGWIGDKWGRKLALTITLWGMAIITLLTGLLPTYASVGVVAPVLFITFRMIQKFFSAGEYTGGAIFTQEHTAEGRRGYASGVYSSFTVIGIIAASFMAMGIASTSSEFWRAAYIVGFATALTGVYLRRQGKESPEFAESQSVSIDVSIPKTKDNLINSLCVIFTSGCFSTLCCLPTMFLTAFLPEISSVTLSNAILINIIALACYGIVLPFAGKAADHYGYRRVMMFGASATAIFSLPLFYLLSLDILWVIVAVKITFAVLGAWFIAPFHAFVQTLFSVKQRYKYISIAYSIGSKIGGAATPAVAFWLWKSTHQLYAPALVLMIWTGMGALGVWLAKKSKEV